MLLLAPLSIQSTQHSASLCSHEACVCSSIERVAQSVGCILPWYFATRSVAPLSCFADCRWALCEFGLCCVALQQEARGVSRPAHVTCLHFSELLEFLLATTMMLLSSCSSVPYIAHAFRSRMESTTATVFVFLPLNEAFRVLAHKGKA